MTQAFISYRHISPDQDLAGFLEGYLTSRGIDVFIDTQMLVGDKWVEEIERQIRASSFLTHDADSYANGPLARAVLIPMREFSFWVHYYYPKGGSSPCPLLMKPPTRA